MASRGQPRRPELCCDTPRSKKHQLQPGERERDTHTHRERGREGGRRWKWGEQKKKRETETGETPENFTCASYTNKIASPYGFPSQLPANSACWPRAITSQIVVLFCFCFCFFKHSKKRRYPSVHLSLSLSLSPSRCEWRGFTIAQRYRGVGSFAGFQRWQVECP